MEKTRGIILIASTENIINEVRDTFEMDGYELIIAHDGREALEKIYSESPDIVVLDVKMPYITGFEVCEKIREDVLMDSLPIIMLTAKGSEKDEVRGLELGVDDYLTKPFRPAILLARVRAALSRAQQGLNVNPLTHLPSHNLIYREIERRLSNNKDFTFLYIDIDRFKLFNDKYGTYRGDQVLKQTARIIVDNIAKYIPRSFVGHNRGDDFFCIIDKDIGEDTICESIIREFDEMLTDFHSKEELAYEGNLEEYPLMAISIAVVKTKDTKFDNIDQIFSFSNEMMKYAKKDIKSNYVMHRERNNY